MKNTNIPRIVSLATIIMLATACRTHKQLTSSSTISTTVCSASIDSAAQRLMSQHHRTTRITVLPMQTPALPPIPTPDAPAPVQDLITQLLEQGGGTIIITQEEQLQNDTTTVTHTTTDEQTQDESESNETQSQSNPPRASPWIDRIFYTFLAAAFIVVLLQGRTRQ